MFSAGLGAQIACRIRRRPLLWCAAMARGNGRFAWVLMALTVGVASCGGGEPERTVLLDAGGTSARPPSLFAPDSVWNAPLSADAALDPASPRHVRALMREVEAERRARTGPWIQTTSYSTPIYRVGADQPTVNVTLENHEPWAETLQAALREVPIPGDARPAVGTDAHLTIWQPSSDRLWELWRAHRETDGWHAAWGGAIEHVSRSPGYYTRASWPGAESYWGATATSLPVAAGTMTIAELRRGEIDHALAINLPTTRANAYSFPAQRTDGIDPDPRSLPEGAHLRLDPDLDVASLYLPRLTEMIALAAQRYGMIVRDQTHHAIGFYAEDPAQYRANPYPALMDYAYPIDLLADFPWQHVQLLKMDVRQGTGRPQ